jgi:putative heme-binding domain-containing protein
VNVQQAAFEVIARRPAWSGLAQSYLRKWLAAPRLSPTQQRTLTDLLISGTEEPGVQQLVASLLANPATPVATQLLLVDVWSRCRFETLPASWLVALGEALNHSDLAVRRAAVAAVQMRKVRQLDRHLRELSRQPTLPADLRIMALECLADHGAQLVPEAFTLLCSHLSAGAEPLLRLAAARTLRVGALGDEQLIHLAGSMPGLSTMVLRLLLPAFTRTTNPKVGNALVEALQNSPSAEALSVTDLDRALQGYAAEVRNQARVLREKLVARQKGQAAYLARLTEQLSRLPGDPEAGQEVFLSPKVGCYGCHRAVGRGGDIGPDLSRIGLIRTQAELLESIVFPSFTIAPEYRAYQVATKSGRVATGLIVRDSAEALYLRTAELAEIRIARPDVEEITPSTVSLMPEGLEKLMNRQELRNLLEFLRRQR